mmetsp:Transcript_31848/g.85091  ORF Transcript_31848/g.85091 Transcript_31848/m.85091 type:complete len:205 (-) Transcript_31848:143-757(-)
MGKLCPHVNSPGPLPVWTMLTHVVKAQFRLAFFPTSLALCTTCEARIVWDACKPRYERSANFANIAANLSSETCWAHAGATKFSFDIVLWMQEASSCVNAGTEGRTTGGNGTLQFFWSKSAKSSRATPSGTAEANELHSSDSPGIECPTCSSSEDPSLPLSNAPRAAYSASPPVAGVSLLRASSTMASSAAHTSGARSASRVLV